MSYAEQRADRGSSTTRHVHSDWCRAAAALGWDGFVIEDVELLGLQITVVAAVDCQAHADRKASGWGPVTDYTTLAMWEDWPEALVIPPSPVRLVGFAAAAQRWQQAMGRVGGFVGFGSTAILLGHDTKATPVCVMTAHYYGIAVARRTRNGHVDLVQEGRRGPVTARPSSLSRVAEESIYQEILNRGLIV